MSIHAELGWYKGEGWSLGFSVFEMYLNMRSLYLFHVMFLKFRFSIEITW